MDIGWPEILIIAAVILVLFGSKKLPDAARSLGRSMRILKTEVKGLNDDDPAQQQSPQQLPPASASTAPPPSAGAPTEPPTAPPAATAADAAQHQHETR